VSTTDTEIPTPGKEDKLYHEFTALVADLKSAAEVAREARSPRLSELHELWGDYQRVRAKFQHRYLFEISRQHLPTVHAYAQALTEGNAVDALVKAVYVARGGQWPGVREG
jgi:hypothetical protein